MLKKVLAVVFVFVLGVSFAGCQSDDNDGKVIIGSKPHSEQYILGEMLSLLIRENTDIEVEKKFGIAGGTSNLHPAILSGEIDMYPEYTGTGWMFVLKEDLIKDPEKLYEATKKAYEENFNIRWLGTYGFNNTYGLALKESLADELNVETYSDLAKVSDRLVFGAEYDFYERDDGYNALVETYGFNFKDTKEMEIALKYKAIDSGDVDVVNVFSTDGALRKYNLKVLEDDMTFFPSYKAATIIRNDTLKKYPELERLLSKLDGQITEKEMIEMNYQVEVNKEDPEDVARTFLKEKGLVR